MKSLFGVLLASSAVIVANASPVGAQNVVEPPPHVLVQNMPEFIEGYLAQLMQLFRTSAGEDQILTAEDVSRQRQIAQARQRANLLVAFFAADLDGDMSVSSQEWQIVSRNREFRAADFARWDTDKNGTVTFEEALASSEDGQSRMRGLRRDLPLAGLMELEAAKDGTLTAAELEKAGRDAFGFYDKDGSGALSPEEMTIAKRDQAEALRGSAMQMQFAACGLPKPEGNQKVLFVSIYEGQALSDVAVAGMDTETTTAEIKIEAGEDPLFVMAAAYEPMVWRVTGAVERVARFVATSDTGGAGVTGLDRNKVTALPKGPCVQRLSESETTGRASLRTLSRGIGKPIDGAYSAYALSTITLPSQAMPPESWRQDKSQRATEFSWGPLQPIENATTAELKRFNPGGIISIDPSKVVTTGKAERYDVLPQEAGLAQLLENGSLRFDPKMGYIVQRPIPRFPAGLAGAHSVRFVLSEGVPRPAGNPGHSAVMTYAQAEKRATAPVILRAPHGIEKLP